MLSTLCSEATVSLPRLTPMERAKAAHVKGTKGWDQGGHGALKNRPTYEERWWIWGWVKTLYPW